jgi:hypothetical protein
MVTVQHFSLCICLLGTFCFLLWTSLGNSPAFIALIERETMDGDTSPDKRDIQYRNNHLHRKFSDIDHHADISPFSRILLVVQYNFAADQQRVREHYAMYNQHFRHIVIYGSWNRRTVEGLRRDGVPIFSSNWIAGTTAYRSMLMALNSFSKYDFQGFLWLHDDMVLNLRNMHSMDLSKPWIVEPTGNPLVIEPWDKRNYTWYWLNGEVGIDAMQNILEARPDIKEKIRSCTGSEHSWWIGQGQADFFYLPKSFIPDFLDIVGSFSKYQLFLEIAIPTFMQCFACQNQSCQALKLCTTFTEERERRDLKFYRACGSGYDLFHPIKLDSSPAAYTFTKEYLNYNITSK